MIFVNSIFKSGNFSTEFRVDFICIRFFVCVIVLGFCVGLFGWKNANCPKRTCGGEIDLKLDTVFF